MFSMLNIMDLEENKHREQNLHNYLCLVELGECLHYFELEIRSEKRLNGKCCGSDAVYKIIVLQFFD